jgi:hypothetical protein
MYAIKPDTIGIENSSVFEKGRINKSTIKASMNPAKEKIKLPYKIKMLGLVFFTYR